MHFTKKFDHYLIHSRDYKYGMDVNLEVDGKQDIIVTSYFFPLEIGTYSFPARRPVLE